MAKMTEAFSGEKSSGRWINSEVEFGEFHSGDLTLQGRDQVVHVLLVALDVDQDFKLRIAAFGTT